MKQDIVEKGSSPEQRLLALYRKVTKEDMLRAYNIKGVNFDKVNIFSEFITELINTVYDTFLGNDSINNEQDIITHFKWCYDKVAKRSTLYKFEDNQELYDYFMEYFRINIYLCEESRDIDFDYFTFFLKPNENEQRFQIDSFLDLYDIFDRTEKKGRVLVSKPKVNRLRR
jgi:hypothetical protein